MSIPYQDLYIYEVSGEVTDSRLFFQQDFIGCWNEGEISCLFFSAPHDDEVYAFLQKKGFRLLSRNVMDYGSWQAGEELKPFNVGTLFSRRPGKGGRPKKEKPWWVKRNRQNSFDMIWMVC